MMQRNCQNKNLINLTIAHLEVYYILIISRYPYYLRTEVLVPEQSAERLALLRRVSLTINSSLDLDLVLNQVIDEVIAATRAELGILLLRETDGQLTIRAARGMDQQSLDASESHISRGVVERVATEGEPLLTSNAQLDSRLDQRASIHILGLRSILCVPLKVKGATIGVIYVDNHLQAGIFSQDDLDLLSAIAASAAIAIENARLYQVAIEKGRIESELQMARDVQFSFIPRHTPEIAGWELAAWWQPAREVSGDFYDFIPIAATATEPQPLGLTIADVSDKGMEAAMFMVLTRSTVRASISPNCSPASSITSANRLISSDSPGGMFVTLFYAQLNPGSGEFCYVNAGHNPPLLYRKSRNRFSLLARTGMALGVEAEERYEQRTEIIESGDFIFLYTDGITDATNRKGDYFGEERLNRILRENRRSSAGEIVAAFEDALNEFVGSSTPFDDITALVLRRL
jgi:sigma-B regulation protein RsbU (phosphoserine phosphatase)